MLWTFFFGSARCTTARCTPGFQPSLVPWQVRDADYRNRILAKSILHDTERFKRSSTSWRFAAVKKKKSCYDDIKGDWSYFNPSSKYEEAKPNKPLRLSFSFFRSFRSLSCKGNTLNFLLVPPATCPHWFIQSNLTEWQTKVSRN